jgi:hypothetical protein
MTAAAELLSLPRCQIRLEKPLIPYVRKQVTVPKRKVHSRPNGGIYAKMRASGISIADFGRLGNINAGRLYRQSPLSKAEIERVLHVIAHKEPTNDDELRENLSIALVSGHAVAQLSLPVEYVHYPLPQGFVLDSITDLDSAELAETAETLDRLSQANDPQSLMTFCASYFER